MQREVMFLIYHLAGPVLGKQNREFWIGSGCHLLDAGDIIVLSFLGSTVETDVEVDEALYELGFSQHAACN